MKIILRRKVNVQCFSAIATIEYLSEQKAYQEILQIEPFNHENIEKKFQDRPEPIRKRISIGLIKFFQDQKIIDNDLVITEKGRKIVSDGLIQKQEMGKFVFWVVNDEFFSYGMIHFERDPSNTRENVQETAELNKLEKAKFKSFVDGSEFLWKKFENVRKNLVSYIHLEQNDTELLFEINIDISPERMEILEARYSLKGKLKNINTYNIHQESNLDNIDLHKLMGKILPNDIVWDEEIWGGGCSFELIQQQHPKAIYNYISNLSNHQVPIEKWGIFDDVIISAIPLLPLKIEDAHSWIEYQIVEMLSKKYLTQEELLELQEKTRSQHSFTRYATIKFQIPLLTKKLFRTGNYIEYWHLQSAFDIL